MPTKAELELRLKEMRAEQEVFANKISAFWANRGEIVRVWIEEKRRHYPARSYAMGTSTIHVPAFSVTIPEIKSDLVNGRPLSDAGRLAA